MPTNSLPAIPTPTLPVLSFTPTSTYTPTPYCGNGPCNVRIYIFDDEGQFVDDAIIRGEILIEECKKRYFMDDVILSGKSKNGQVFFNVPTAIAVKYIVSKEGYRTKELIYFAIKGIDCITNDIYFGCPAQNIVKNNVPPCSSDGKAPSYAFGSSQYALSRIK